jgi:hypothetical protein
MKLRGVMIVAGCWLLAGMTPSYASETGPVIVIPGRPGVPIIVNGQDISGAVIEGDWGLARPSQNEPRILYRYRNGALIGPSSGGYFPTSGRLPRVGRKEVDVPRPLQASETFFRSFNAQSDQTPVTPPQSVPQQPPVVVTPPPRRHHP